MAAAAAAAARRGRDNRAGRGGQGNPASMANSPMAKLLRTNTVQLGNSNAAKQGQVKRYFPSFKSKSFSAMSKKVRPAKESINIPALLDGIDDGLADDFKHMNTSMKVGPLKLKVIQPDASWKNNYWDWIVILLVLYNSFFIPYNFSFLQKRNASIEMFDYLVDIVFLIDMGLSFFTGFYDKRGDEVLNLTAIRAKYMSGWFWIDFVAIFPFEILILMAGFNLETSIFNLFKAPRLLRLGKLAKKLDQLSGANVLRIFKLLLVFTLFAHWVACVWFFVGRFQDEGNLWIGSVWLVENDLCQTVKGPGNWVDGVYVQVPENEVGTAYMVEGVEACIKGGEYASEDQQSWAVNEQMFLDNSTRCLIDVPMPEFPHYCHKGVAETKPDATIFTQYITSFYWALTTLTTIGYGDVTPSTNSERTFVVIIMLFGAILYASIFGNVAVLIQNFDAMHANYTDKMNKLHEFSNFYEISPEMYEKLIVYTEKQHRVSSTPQIAHFLQDFPSALKGEVAFAIHGMVIGKMQQRHPWTASMENMAFLRTLFIRLYSTICLKGEIILSRVEVSKQLYIVSRGCVSLTIFVKKESRANAIQEDKEFTEDESVSEINHILEIGEIFGEFKAMLGGRHMIEAKALTFCELLALSHQDFRELALDYTRELELFRDNMQQRFFYVTTQPKASKLPVEDDDKSGSSTNASSSECNIKTAGHLSTLEKRMQDVEDRMMSTLDTLEQYMSKHEMKSTLLEDKK